MKNNIISIFDTSIASYNIGNQIIMDAVNLEINELFPESFIISLPVEDIKAKSRLYNRISETTFVGGTNILNSDIRKYRQWDLTLHNIIKLSNIVLLGCGWWQYEHKKTTIYTKWAINRILSSKYIHSVRDEYTQKRLAKIGVKSINTGCPTLWRITNKTINLIPEKKNKDVVITLTDYNKKIERDTRLLDICLSNYDNVFLFPQGTGDIKYIKDLGYDQKIKFISPQLTKYNEILESKEIDYIGTRLHAGIRALQKSVRAFIIGIDNRAKEMAHDFNIPVIDESNIANLEKWINEPYKLNLNIPFDNIKRWKEQFHL